MTVRRITKLEVLRRQLGLTLDELADKADTYRMNIWRIEQGRRRPSDEELAKLAKVLGFKGKDLTKLLEVVS